MTEWAQRAGQQDMEAIQARIQRRKEQGEEDHTARVVRRLASLTKRMDSLNSSLSSFWNQNAGSPGGSMQLPSVRVVYSDVEYVQKAIRNREPPSGGIPDKRTRLSLLEVRVRLAIPHDRQDIQRSLLEALGKSPVPPSGA